jgi:hypothetical protein
VAAHQRSLSSQVTLRADALGTSATVVQVKRTLIDREIIGTDGGVQWLDPIYVHWLRTHCFGG